MKEIIYLDTNFLNSFMAQTHRGLPSNSTHEQFEQDTRTDSSATKRQGTHDVTAQLNTGSVNIPFISVSPNGTVTYKYSANNQADEVFSLTQLEAGKEIISKQLHDNSLIEFENYLETINIETITNVNEPNLENLFGKYVKVSADFSIFDFDYLKSIADPNALIEVMKQTNPHAQSGDVEETKKMFELIGSFIEYLGNILPTNLFLRQGLFISPLKKEHLRESSSELNFKYGGGSKLQIHVLAKATRVFEDLNIDMFEGNSNLEQLSSMMSGVTEMILKTVSAIKKGDIILSPVAIYFE
ncbi:hypothetical protein JOD82_005501 [Paenibacillus sp. 1182]|uniref:DUF6414 family protein n=1 Tax=Paenibacillus sp. 1182 TaxID=2806565 RepID=UPI001AE834FB|nr:hypothetical protein [Paenibacillus sp. 1182]MBP1312356.1 hypothetical protein [Paenibacillus sp. 1182]